MDRLEEFIRENRKELDIYDPDPVIWEKIDKEVRTSGRPFLKWIAAAAVLIIILGSALAVYLGNEKQNPDYLSAKSQQHEFKETEIFYTTVVNDLYREAEPFLTKQPDMQRELYSDMARIDSICKEIRKDLRDNIANQEVIEALVQNYRIKIQILEEMLNTLREEDGNNLNERKDEI
jgi:hypothetical protein